jgi:hypothetical protein
LRKGEGGNSTCSGGEWLDELAMGRRLGAMEEAPAGTTTDAQHAWARWGSLKAG